MEDNYIHLWLRGDLARYIKRSEYLDEVMRLLLAKHGISFVYVCDWNVCDREKGRLQSFPTFSKAFEFAMSLLERINEATMAGEIVVEPESIWMPAYKEDCPYCAGTGEVTVIRKDDSSLDTIGCSHCKGKDDE